MEYGQYSGLAGLCQMVGKKRFFHGKKTRLANSFLLVLPQLSSKSSFSQFFEVFLTVFRMPSG